MMYSGMSISVAIHSQKQVAIKKPMKNSRVKNLATASTLYWKKTLAHWVGYFIFNIVMPGQGQGNFSAYTFLYAHVIGSGRTLIKVQCLDSIQYPVNFVCYYHFNPCLLEHNARVANRVVPIDPCAVP